MTEERLTYVTDDWLQVHVADKLGISLISARESLEEETIKTAEEVVKAVELEESRLRLDRGWSYTYKNFNAARSLKRIAKHRQLGMWGNPMPTQGVKPEPDPPRRYPEERPETKERKKRQKRTM